MQRKSRKPGVEPVVPFLFPPSIEVVAGTSAAARLARARRWLEAAPSADDVGVVATTREAADAFARSYTYTRGATFGLERFGLTELLVRLAGDELTTRGLAPASALALHAVATRVAAQALADDTLEYFAPVAVRPGFNASLVSTLTELRLAGIEADRLRTCPRVGHDLADLLTRFERALADARLADRATLVALATERLARDGGPLEGRRVVLLDVPFVSVLDRAMARALVRRVASAIVTMPSADTSTAEAFTSLGAVTDVAPHDEASPLSLTRVQQHLFSATVPDTLTDRSGLDEDGGVAFFSAPGEGREAIEIARRAVEHARAGVPFDRMAIVVRAPQVYAGLLESALLRAGVPAWFGRGTRRPDPSGRAFLALLACAEEGVSAARFAEYLSFGQVPLASSPAPADRPWTPPEDESLRLPLQIDEGTFQPAAGGSRPVVPADDDEASGDGSQPTSTPSLWEGLLNEAAVIGGGDRWRRRLDGLSRELRLRRDELAQENPDAARLAGLDRRIAAVADLADCALPMVEHMAAWPAAALWAVWLDELEALARLALRRPDRVLGALADLRALAAVGPVRLREVSQALVDRLRDLHIDPPDMSAGRIFVGTPDLVRGREFDVVFVPGLTERVFPQRARQDPLLLDKARTSLGNLAVESDRLREERLRLHLAVGAATRQLWVSWPRMDMTSARQRVPSFYALDVERARSGAALDFTAIMQRADAEGGARLAWPAPADATRAIDAMEHDLATLGPLLHAPSKVVQGRARYLLELSAPLGRSLRTRFLRWGRPKEKNRPWSWADGLVLGTVVVPGESEKDALARREAVTAALDGHRLRHRAYSPSSLQQFAVCPYRFFLSAIHRLAPREEVEATARLDPLTRGSLVHEVQAAVIRSLTSAGVFPIDATSLPQALAALDDGLNDVSERYRDDLAPPVGRVWDDDIERIRGDLHGWLQRVSDRPDRWIPIHVELGFGFPPGMGRDPASLAEAAILPGGFRLHGIVDLVEEKDGTRELRVIDHKTGRRVPDARVVVGGGELLQPVLYGLAIEAALSRPVIESRLSYCTADAGYVDRIVKLASPAFDDHRRRGVEVLEIVDRHVEEGFLPAAPRDGACAWCDFRPVCGPHEETRVTRKNPDRLADLEALRGME